MAFQKHKTAGDGAEAVAVDSVDYIHAARGIELQESGSDSLNVFELAKLVSDFDRHGGAAEPKKDGSGGRLQHDVGTDSFDALCGFREQAAGEPHDQDDERH